MIDPSKTQALTADPNRTQLGAPPTIDPNKTMLGTAPSLNTTVTIKPVQCPVCKTFNPTGVMFCIDCGLIFDRALEGDVFGAPAVQLPVLVDGNGREHPIRPGLNSIGREGDVMLVDPRVSRRHAQISSTDGALTLEDLGSTNGTQLNGTPLAQGEQRALTEGDSLSFGGLDLRLSLPGETHKTAAIPSNKTAAILAPPRVQAAPAYLVGGDLEMPMKPGINSFGRKSENDLVISDAYVSGKHGLIELSPEGVFLTDIGSTNGTLLNDAKLAPNMRTQIGPDDVIRLGSLELRVRVEA